MNTKISPRRVKALIKKEFYQIIRDISSILICVVLPTILLFVYGYGVSLDIKNLRIGLVLEDTTPDARSLAESFTNSPYFDVTVVRDRRELEHDIIRGRLRGMVVIPSYFSAFEPRRSTVTPIQVLTDGSEPNTANFVKNYATGAFQKWLTQQYINRKLAPPPAAIPAQRFWYNEQLESRNFLVPGSFGIIMTLIGTLLTALVVSREWERGTMEALMSTPVTIYELLIGKLIPYFILGFTSMAICTGFAILFYHIPFRGSFWALALVSSIFLLTALGVGLIISTIAKNQFVASQAAMISSFLPAFILSGFIFEISSMPPVIQFITNFVPAKYFVTSLQTLFLVGDVWQLLLFNCFAMLCIGLVIYAITARITVKRLD